MGPQPSILTPVLLSLCTLLAGPTLAAQCTPCQTYAQDLSYVSYNFDTNAASGGPIKQIDIGAMCLTGAGLNNMLACYACGSVTGHDLQILEAWIVDCNTLAVSGQAAALACWNTDKSQCVTVAGVDAPSALSLAPTATSAAAPTTSADGGSAPGTTAGGDGGSDTETVTSTEADATATTTKSTGAKTSDTALTESTSGPTRSGSGSSASTTASGTSTPKQNSGDKVAHAGVSNANLALWLAVVGFLL